MPWKQRVIIPSIEKMYQDICGKGLENEFVNYMLDNTSKGSSLGQWLGKHGFRKRF